MKTVLLLLIVVSVAVSAPTPDASGSAAAARSDPQSQQQRPARRVARQAAGADILGQVSEAFQEHVAQKMQRVTDVLGSLGIRVAVPNVVDALPTGIVSMAEDIAEEDA